MSTDISLAFDEITCDCNINIVNGTAWACRGDADGALRTHQPSGERHP
jgi:hypothetical protein